MQKSRIRRRIAAFFPITRTCQGRPPPSNFLRDPADPPLAKIPTPFSTPCLRSPKKNSRRISSPCGSKRSPPFRPRISTTRSPSSKASSRKPRASSKAASCSANARLQLAGGVKKKGGFFGGGMGSMKLQSQAKKDPLGTLALIEKDLEKDPLNEQLNELLFDTCVKLEMFDTAAFALETVRQRQPGKRQAAPQARHLLHHPRTTRTSPPRCTTTSSSTTPPMASPSRAPRTPPPAPQC